MASPRMSRLMIWVKIVVLQVTKLLTGYVMSVMSTYLNSVWKMSLTHAAAVVNLYGGTVPIMQWAMKFIVAKTGNCRMIRLSRCAIITGFTLLTMSTPPVLHKATGTCSAYEAECIGKVQKILFYTALPLIALGVSGGFMVDEFREEQLIKPLLEGTKRTKLFCCSVSRKTKLNSLQFLVAVLVLVTIAYVKLWWLRFGIAAICNLVAALTLLISIRPIIKAQRSLFTAKETKSILRMSPICSFLILIGVVSALGNTYFTNQASKMNHKVGPLKVSILFLTLPRNMVKGWLSKSKWCTNIIGPRIGILLSMALAVLCCIISAVIEKQRLDVIKSYGLLDKPKETIPMTIFWLLPQYILLGGVCGLSENSFVRFFTDEVLHLPKIEKNGETKEESKATEQDTEDSSVRILVLKSPSDRMEVFKRTEKDGEVPNQAQDQSKSTDCTEKDNNEEKEESKRQYIDFFVDAVSGVGTIFSMLVVYIVGQIEPSWFRGTLNRSHLDYYYWTLAALSGANLLLFLLVMYLLGPEKQQVDDTTEVINQNQQN